LFVTESTGDEHRRQAQETSTGDEHRRQAQETSTGDKHKLSISSVLTVIFEVLRGRIQQAFKERAMPDVIQLVGTRTTTKATRDGGAKQLLKNSFHLIFPPIVFAGGNKGLMKEITS
jgi:hypothetical protein